MKIGTVNINNLKLGTNQINKVYLGTNLVWSNILPETQAVINRALLEGFTLPSTSTLTALNNLIGNMISSGYWIKRDLILIFVYNDLSCLNFSRINIKNPLGNLVTYGVGHNYLLQGSQGGGSNTSFVDTNWNFLNNSSNYTLNNASREVIITNSVLNSIIDGANGGFSEIMRNSTAQTIRINSGTSGATMNVIGGGEGYKAINRTTSTNITLIVGDSITSTTLTSTVIPNQEAFIHRGNFINGTNTIGYYSIGAEVVTEGQFLRTAFNNYLTAIGLSAIA